MKKTFLLAAVLLLLTVTNSFSQYGLSKGKLNSSFDANWKGQSIDFPASASNCNTVHTGAYEVLF